MQPIRTIFLWLALPGAVFLAGLYAPLEAAGGPLPRMAKNALYYAQQAAEKQENDEAIGILESYLEEHKTQPPEIFLMLGNILFTQNDPGKAIAVYRQGLSLHPGNPELTLNAAVAAYQAGHFNESALLFISAYNLQPAGVDSSKEPDLLYKAASAHCQEENWPAAETVLLRLTDEAGTVDHEWLKLLVHVQTRQENWADARETVDRLLALEPDDAPVWQLLAQIHIHQKQYRQAAAALEIAYRIESPEKSGWEDLAELYRYINAPLKAAACYKNAYGTDMDRDQYELLAELYARAFRYENAVSMVQKAIDLKPTAEGYLKKGQYLYRTMKVADAAKAFEHCLQLDPDNPKANLMLGFCSLDLKDWQQARRSFSRAAENEDYRSWAQGRLAVVEDLIAAQQEVQAYQVSMNLR
jgi:tetratricopeptide (TPR) repeat protein